MVSFAQHGWNPEWKLMALASVSDKTGIVEFCSWVIDVQGRFWGRIVDILTTGGTAKLLWDKGVPAREVSDHTHFPEMFDGRLKTLHPKLHGGFLERPGVEADKINAKKHGIERIGLIAVNLYDFSGAVAQFEQSDKTVEDFARVMENIDIWWPSMLRSADKWETTVIMNPAHYGRVLDEMNDNEGDITPEFEVELKRDVFSQTGQYDLLIFAFLWKYPQLHKEYLIAKRQIMKWERDIFECWKPKQTH